MPDNIVTIDFRRHFHIEAGDLLLDLGSGNGRHTVEAARWPCRVISVDVSMDELRRSRFFLRARPGDSPWEPYPREQRRGDIRGWGEFLVADAQHLPFKDGVFDRLLCTEVLEHIPDDRAGIAELHRVAKAGAEVAVSVPRHGPERVFWALSWEYWHTPGGHVRVYRPGQMWDYLQQQGFELRAVRYRHAFQSMYWFLRCTFGKDNERRLVPRLFQKFIDWYHGTRPKALERAEAAANLVIGKDMVIYGRKRNGGTGGDAPPVFLAKTGVGAGD
jgi:ubiquinone/menaquinone biosynthesis C-methylase UbiE